MLLILIAIIVLALLGFMLVVLATNGNDIFAAYVVGMFCIMGASLGIIGYSFAIWSYIAAEYKADIINREYGTNYTQAEVYWAADVIDTVRELDRKRIELNGDLLRTNSVEE